MTSRRAARPIRRTYTGRSRGRSSRTRGEVRHQRPIAPRPMTPRFLPQSSGPAKALCPFQRGWYLLAPAGDGLHPFDAPQDVAGGHQQLEDDHFLSCVCVRAGALKTTIPDSEQRRAECCSSGPGPADAQSSGQNSVQCRSAERMSSASGRSSSWPTSQPCFARMSDPEVGDCVHRAYFKHGATPQNPSYTAL